MVGKLESSLNSDASARMSKLCIMFREQKLAITGKEYLMLTGKQS